MRWKKGGTSRERGERRVSYTASNILHARRVRRAIFPSEKLRRLVFVAVDLRLDDMHLCIYSRAAKSRIYRKSRVRRKESRKREKRDPGRAYRPVEFLRALLLLLLPRETDSLTEENFFRSGIIRVSSAVPPSPKCLRCCRGNSAARGYTQTTAED